jgi:hypothetical protein
VNQLRRLLFRAWFSLVGMVDDGRRPCARCKERAHLLRTTYHTGTVDIEADLCNKCARVLSLWQFPAKDGNRV